MTTHDDPTAPLRPSDSEGQAGIPENPYEDEAREHWGHTDAWKQSQERAKKLTKEDWARIQKAGDDLMKEIVAAVEAGKAPSDPDVLTLIARHYDGLRTFYEPNLQMYRGLADMYVGDHRFAAFYDKYRPGLATFMRDAMHAYADVEEGK